MIEISHMALNVRDIEEAKKFYVQYFGAEVNTPQYQSTKTGLETYFLSFANGSRLELMNWPEMTTKPSGTRVLGFVHVAFSLGSKEAVDALTARLKNDGVPVLSGPRITGDGYYESLVQDPEGNWIEITV
jgi:lactoylglutathione lyase